MPAMAITSMFGAAHASVSIDTFADASSNLTFDGVGSDVQQVITASAIGGNRELRVHNTAADTPTDTNHAFTDNTGAFTWNVDTGASGHFHLSYGSLMTDPVGAALDADFSADNALEINVLFADQAGAFNVYFLVNEGEANESTWKSDASVFLPSVTGSVATEDSPYALTYEFANFTQEGGSGATFDVTDVDGILIEAGEDMEAADWKFNFVESTTVVVTAVPEPSSVALLGLGGLALAMRRRRA